jgi:hypothetical protein
MEARELPGCCGLKVIYDLQGLVGDDDWSQKEAARFDTVKVKYEQARGANCTATIVTIEDSHPANFKQQVAFLGFKLLGCWPAKDDPWLGPRHIYLYGSREIKKRKA